MKKDTEVPAGFTVTKEAARCGNCKFYFLNDALNLKQGVCRIRAPKAFILPGPGGQPTGLGVFPPVKGDELCGEHRPRVDL